MYNNIIKILKNSDLHLVVIGEKENGKSFFISELLQKKLLVQKENILIINLLCDRSFKNIRYIINTFLKKLTNKIKYAIIHNFDEMSSEIQSYFGSIIHNNKKCKYIFVVKNLKYLLSEIKNISVLYYPKFNEKQNDKSIKFNNYLAEKNMSLVKYKKDSKNDYIFHELLQLKGIGEINNFLSIYQFKFDDFIFYIQKLKGNNVQIIKFLNEVIKSQIYMLSNGSTNTNIIKLIFLSQSILR